MTRRTPPAGRQTLSAARESLSVAQEAHRAVQGGSGGAMRLTVPYPPSVNHLWRRVGAKTLLSAEGRRYHEVVGTHVRRQGGTPPDPPHVVRIVAVVPDKRRRDIDNILKALLDPLYRAIGMDDSAIVRLEIEKRETDEMGARVEITLAPASQEDASR